MKRLLAVVAVSAATLSLANAQTDTRWTHPNGYLSLEYEALGWSRFSDLEMPAGYLLSIEHEQFQKGGRMRACFVSQRATLSRAGVSQQGLNLYAGSRTAADMASLGGTKPIQVVHVDVDGITVIDIVQNEPNIRRHLRVFYLHEGDQALQFIIACSASDPVTPEVADNISALLRTLRIRPR